MTWRERIEAWSATREHDDKQATAEARSTGLLDTIHESPPELRCAVRPTAAADQPLRPTIIRVTPGGTSGL